MESTLLIFFVFIILSLVGAKLLFTYFKSRKSQAPLIKTDSTNKQSHNQQTTIAYFKQKKQRDPDPKFLLSNEEKESRSKFFIENLNPLDSNFILLDLVEYINENLNINELRNTKSYASIPIDPLYPDSKLSRLKKHALIDPDGYFSARGFDLLCILARFMESDFLNPSVDKNDLSDSLVNPN